MVHFYRPQSEDTSRILIEPLETKTKWTETDCEGLVQWSNSAAILRKMIMVVVVVVVAAAVAAAAAAVVMMIMT